MISGTQNNYELVLRTGAWGRDIFVPGAIAGIITGPGEPIPCDPRAGSQCPPTNRAQPNIPLTPLQTMYYDGMEYLKCSNDKTGDM
jgi:hypothetical protein